MRSHVARCALVVAVLGGVWACSKDSPPEPRSNLLAVHSSVSALTSGTLTASIGGDAWVTAGGTYTWTATVSGGTPPYRYAWYTRWCNVGPTGTTCDTTYLRQTAETTATLHYRINGYDTKNDIVLQVQDATMSDVSAADSLTVTGPIEPDMPIPKNFDFNCDMGSGPAHYPLITAGPGPDTLYRRNPCSGIREVYGPYP